MVMVGYPLTPGSVPGPMWGVMKGKEKMAMIILIEG